MKIYIIRHGEKNIEDLDNKRISNFDVRLSEEGYKQSRFLKDYFLNIDIQAIYISEYLRTKQTIELISNVKRIRPIVKKDLNEINTGKFLYLNDYEKREYYPNEWDCLNISMKDFRYPDGESGDEVSIRVKRILNELIEKDENCILVTHEGWMKIAICTVLGIKSDYRFHFVIDTASIMELEYDQTVKYWRIIDINMKVGTTI
jgi:broad specificity phosphatase PhoE